ncbi:DUF2157 domain-containing protein [Gammaproteobacteria bacterium PRO6]|nr:DUF2157 domain-containing protein [Gammaproteobacteria bacterium PRO6]
MDIARDEVLRLALAHRLDAGRTRALFALAGLDRPPSPPALLLQRALAALAALLVGLGVVFLVAANWHEIGRFAKFGGVAALVLLAGAAAWARPGPMRAPLALLALLASGALFALLGQTYQTGADPWQLFALWAVLTLPLALGARSDLVWSAWVIVAMAAIALWLHAWSGQRWFATQPQLLAPHLLAWTGLIATVALLGPALVPWTGAGRWSLRIAALLAATHITIAALGGLFAARLSLLYPLGLLTLAAGAWPFTQRRAFDLPILAGLALALDTLIVCGVGRALLDSARHDPVIETLVLGIVAAGLLAASVTALLRLRALRMVDHD